VITAFKIANRESISSDEEVIIDDPGLDNLFFIDDPFKKLDRFIIKFICSFLDATELQWFLEKCNYFMFGKTYFCNPNKPYQTKLASPALILLAALFP